MLNDLPEQLHHEEVERHAYNAAFFELGLRWHWDGATYDALRHVGGSRERLRHYLRSQQPHMLKAYDADCLVRVIEQKVGEHKQRWAESGFSSVHDVVWADARACEIGC